MDDARLDCQIKIAHLKNLIQQFNPTDASPATIVRNANRWNNELDNALNEVVKAVEVCCFKYGTALDNNVVTNLRNEVASCSTQTRTTRDAIFDKLESIGGGSSAEPTLADDSASHRTSSQQ